MTKNLDFRANVVWVHLKAKQYLSTNLTAGLRKQVESKK